MAKRYYSKRYKGKSCTKYLIIGLILIFVALVVVSAYSDNPQLEPLRKQIENMLHSSIPQQKPTYYCDSSEDAASYIYNCVESLVILDTKSATYRIDITPKTGDCHVFFTITRSTFPDFTGKSMTCDCYSQSELSELSKLIDPEPWEIPWDSFKYCEGSLKDEWFEQMEKAASWIA